ncbi:MAG: O-antigen ligase family protein [Candidatus Kapabacteria bacterium]|nr:O-antigen ligase family protein [Candidatus Kapabacteria bacterium]MDW8012482.1 O-antigen ligase family protein [Bacteroidota bacterium]
MQGTGRRERPIGDELPLGFVVALLSVPAGLAGLAVALREELVAAFAVAGLGLTVLLFHRPLLWLFVVALSLAPLTLLQGPTVQPEEVVLVLWLLAGVVGWIGWHVLIQRRQLVEHWGDKLLLLFLGLSTLNLPIALLNDVPIEEWLRRWLPMWLLLYYFPVRYYIRTPRQLLVLLAALLIAGLVVALFSLQRYRAGAMLAEYAYQLRGKYARTQAEHFLAFAILGCIVGAAFLRSLLWRVLLLVCAIVMGAAVVVTFSRTAWMSVAIGLLAAWLWLSWRQRLRAVIAGGALIGISIAVVAVAFPALSSVLLRLAEQRFLSIGQGQRDLAIRGRLEQLGRALEEVVRFPLGGQGIGKAFPYYEPAVFRHIHYEYIHNGYVATAYRYGVPMALLLIAALVGHLWYGIRQLRRLAPDSVARMVTLLGVAGMLSAMLSLMMMENPLDMRATTMVLLWTLALLNLRQPLADAT